MTIAVGTKSCNGDNKQVRKTAWYRVIRCQASVYWYTIQVSLNWCDCTVSCNQQFLQTRTRCRTESISMMHCVCQESDDSCLCKRQYNSVCGGENLYVFLILYLFQVIIRQQIWIYIYFQMRRTYSLIESNLQAIKLYMKMHEFFFKASTWYNEISQTIIVVINKKHHYWKT